ncbi:MULTISPECIES: hypothetical protein [unclassified Chelatococcus]|uniref:hypothetical protein n=1 Tax=unclassified Chelatococcus TaxID=2638111 RepID=UPI0020BF7526|nr:MULTISPECIES: hypothetical protein [unclassified Chelatococcus]MCO5078472.1 hypothetical protein [Chelatococcus sp.]
MVASADTWGTGAFHASGFRGQVIPVVSAKRLVVVQTVDLKQNPRGVRTSAFIGTPGTTDRRDHRQPRLALHA